MQGNDEFKLVPYTPPAKSKSSMRIAPIAVRLSGSLGYNISEASSSARTQLTQGLYINVKSEARSYIYQPWLAKVDGGLEFSGNKYKVDENSGSVNVINGDLGMNLVPYSRFPFEARFTRVERYTGPGLGTGTGFTNSLRLNQEYRTRNKKENYRANYVRSYSSGYKNLDELFGFSATSSRFKLNSLEMNLFLESKLDKDLTNTHDNISLNHEYIPSNEFRLGNLATLDFWRQRSPWQTTANTRKEFSSVASLRPIRTPYSVVGAFRIYETTVDTKKSLGANANLGGNYTLNQYVRFSASGNIRMSDNNGLRTYSASTRQSASGSYSFETIKFDDYNYTRRISANIANSTDSTSSIQSVSVSPSHSLRYQNKSGFGLGLSQSLALSESTRNQASANLNHTASISWGVRNKKTTSSLRVNASDSRSLSRAQNTFQLINMTASYQNEISRHASLYGGINVSASRQTTPYAPESITSRRSSANLSYHHARAFNIPRMSFVSDIRTFSKELAPVLVATPENQGPLTWENKLIYTAGLLSVEFRTNLAKTATDSFSLIALNLRRRF